MFGAFGKPRTLALLVSIAFLVATAALGAIYIFQPKATIRITSGPEDGSCAARAMELAIAQAGVAASDIRHLNAHATSTQVGDRAEIEAIKRVFGRERAIAVSGAKSATGHLLGAAGGLESIFTILALRDQIAPPTLNLETPDPSGDGIDFVANEARPIAMDYAISNGFGFGGVNASVLFRRWSNNSAA